MCPMLLHIYGPFAINAYGFFVAIGLLTAVFLLRQDQRKVALISDDQGLTLLSGSIIAGIVGGKILFFAAEPKELTHWYDIFSFWQGGFTELGSIIGVIGFGAFYLYRNKIKALPLLDLAATYAPIMQGFGRIGCFFAGCCFGLPSDKPWAIIYTHSESLAPLHVMLHPTQLYASCAYFLLFFIMRSLLPLFKKPGQQLTLYLMGASFIRFMLDFWRGDTVFYAEQTVTIYQWIAFTIFFIALIGFLFTLRSRRNEPI